MIVTDKQRQELKEFLRNELGASDYSKLIGKIDDLINRCVSYDDLLNIARLEVEEWNKEYKLNNRNPPTQSNEGEKGLKLS